MNRYRATITFDLHAETKAIAKNKLKEIKSFIDNTASNSWVEYFERNDFGKLDQVKYIIEDWKIEGDFIVIAYYNPLEKKEECYYLRLNFDGFIAKLMDMEIIIKCYKIGENHVCECEYNDFVTCGIGEKELGDIIKQLDINDLK